MGPGDDFRVKNFTVTFKVKFLTEGVIERSWVGISFRKRAQSHYTGTNNLLFTLQRYADSAAVTGHAYAVFDGGEPIDLNNSRELYGDKLTLTQSQYSVPSGAAGADLPWVEYRLDVENNTYKLYADDTLVSDCTFNITKYDYFGYMSLNCCTANVLIDDFLVEVKDTALPPEPQPLAAPEVTVNEESGRIEWQEVEGAYAYKVIVSAGDEKTVYTNYFSLEDLAVGEYDIMVIALAEDTFEHTDSQPSETAHYVVSADVEPEQTGGCNSSLDGTPLMLLICLAAVAGVAAKRVLGRRTDKKI